MLHEEDEKNASLKLVFADLACKRNGLPKWIHSTLGITIQPVLRPDRMKGFQILPKRWIVERALRWLNNDRRLSKDYEQTDESAVAMIHIGQISRIVRQLQG